MKRSVIGETNKMNILEEEEVANRVYSFGLRDHSRLLETSNWV